MDTVLSAPSPTLTDLGSAAKTASRTLATLTADQKHAALHTLADALDASAEAVLAANAEDVAAGRAAGLSEALLDRLLLNETRLHALAADTRQVAGLHDPVGEEIDRRTLANGMTLVRRRTPLGVLGVIYEARPNVTVDIAALALKTGNAAILRGGRETLRTNLALMQVLHDALARTDVPPEALQYIENPDRALVSDLLRLDAYVDMIIPRGGAGLHRLCKEQSTIPVITGGIGICHLYVDATADLDRAVGVVVNAKVQRPSVCNALDTLLVHEAVAARFLPRIAEALHAHGVELRAEPRARALLQDHAAPVAEAGPDDFDQEWLALVLGLKVVGGLGEAIRHVQQHSTAHSDGILTETPAHAARFVNEIDSAAVYVNASTRFTDGGQFGLGAEVAVSTQKLHARGPMGLEALTTYKWIGYGDYHVRA